MYELFKKKEKNKNNKKTKQKQKQKKKKKRGSYFQKQGLEVFLKKAEVQ